ncbi:MAG: hypothetical protein R3A80_01915 [Bdellovibrionota bacterium]
MTFYREERHPWVEKHQNHFKVIEHGDELIDRVQKMTPKIDASKAWVLDLDSTLFDTSQRNREIFKSFLDFKIGTHGKVPDAWRKALESIHPLKQSFSIRESIEWALEPHIGTDSARDESFKIWGDFEKFWEHNFFASTFMNFDKPYEGSNHFAKKIWDLGYSIVYLTGRDMARSLEGTLASLAAFGFPQGERTQLILKPGFRWSMPDVDFKQEASRAISKNYEVVASIDNEPENLHAFAEYFPTSEIVLFHSIMSKRNPESSIFDDLGKRDLILLKNFC